MRWIQDLLVAVQFLTRLPLPVVRFDAEALSRGAKFFPVVGLGVGLGAVAVQRIASIHLNRSLAALSVLIFLVLITGGFHEDGLADAADGFGGGWTRDQVLMIMRDSRIGSFGALALILSILARFLLLSSLPVGRFTLFVVSAHVLGRWTTLPLSFFLPPARVGDGQGARVAQKVSASSILIGTLLSVCIVVHFLRTAFWIPVAVSVVITTWSGLYYSHRIGGVTGDCFGATNQVTEIAVYCCGVWNL
jgi:adenosylcobinamide-GDP ribazoletransferase